MLIRVVTPPTTDWSERVRSGKNFPTTKTFPPPDLIASTIK